jgi:hypothetical protein
MNDSMRLYLIRYETELENCIVNLCKSYTKFSDYEHVSMYQSSSDINERKDDIKTSLKRNLTTLDVVKDLLNNG